MQVIGNSRGISLVAALIAVAVVGMLAATIATLADNMTLFMKRANINAEADNLQRFIQGLMSQTNLCKRALRMGDDTTMVTWPAPGATNPVGRVLLVQLDGAGGTIPIVVAAPGMRIAPGLLVSGLRVRAVDTNGNGVADGPDISSQATRIGDQDRFVYRAQLLIHLRYDDTVLNLLGGWALRERVVNFNAGVGNNGGGDVILDCDAADTIPLFKRCPASDPTACGAAINPFTDFAGDPCPWYGYVGGFLPDGTPSCTCAQNNAYFCPQRNSP